MSKSRFIPLVAVLAAISFLGCENSRTTIKPVPTDIGLAAETAAESSSLSKDDDGNIGAVYTMTNAAGSNEVSGFRVGKNGSLTPIGSVGGAIINQLVNDARSMGYRRLRLESLEFLDAAHTLYRSVGFHDIDPYAHNSMKSYQPAEQLDRYFSISVFMEMDL